MESLSLQIKKGETILKTINYIEIKKNALHTLNV